MTKEELQERLAFIFDALVRIRDRQEYLPLDTAEDLDQIQENIEALREALDETALWV